MAKRTIASKVLEFLVQNDRAWFSSDEIADALSLQHLAANRALSNLLASGRAISRYWSGRFEWTVC